MQEPSVAPLATIVLGGEEYTLRLGVRALRELKINPFKPVIDPDGEPVSQLAKFLDDMDLDKAAQFIRACLLHEYGRRGARYGKEPPTVDDILDDLDLALFDGKLVEVLTGSGLLNASDAPEDGGQANPPTA